MFSLLRRRPPSSVLSLLRPPPSSIMASPSPAPGLARRAPSAWPRGGLILRYLCLGAGMAGAARYSLQRYGGPSSTPEDRLRLAAAAAVTAVVGYLGHRFIQVAYCSEKPRDEVDGALKKVHLKLEETKEEMKRHLDAKVDELWRTAKEKYISEQAKEAFEFIEKICDSLREFGEVDTVDFDTPVVILLALLKRAQDRTDKDWLASLPKESQTSPETFSRHRKLGGYACKVYDASLASGLPKQAAAMDVNEKDVVMAEFDVGDDHCPCFMVLLDRDTSTVVLAIRGTFSLTDVIIDMVCDEEEFLAGHAHRGILRGARLVLGRAGQALRDALEARPGYRLCVTGHSLGAATAELVCMEMTAHPGKYVPKKTEIECVALAPPPVFRTDNQFVLDAVSEGISIYINGQDCIPRTSLASAARLFAALRAIDSLPLTGLQQFLLLAAGSDALSPGGPAAAAAAAMGQPINEEEIKANLDLLERTVAETKQERFPFLEHPGHIHYLFPSEPLSAFSFGDSPSPYVVVKQTSRAFSRQLTVLERMVFDHLEFCYRKAFEKVKLKPSE